MAASFASLIVIVDAGEEWSMMVNNEFLWDFVPKYVKLVPQARERAPRHVLSPHSCRFCCPKPRSIDGFQSVIAGGSQQFGWFLKLGTTKNGWFLIMING